MIANVRSYKKNQVSPDEVITAISRFHSDWNVRPGLVLGDRLRERLLGGQPVFR
ncbi:hypothetical protein OG609_34850 [Streptomyces sp. NBC_01224]|uniref:hypothetical protein n=1 Tax=Streptomyces sp. NBC_01224 TaxID=2903783 RepID=UPI002E157C07|nr:hypothetical protein OG609_34850 [Streptomyces sp. NBC_01224]